MKNKRGFTLVELLGVLVVLAVLLIIAYPLITTYVRNTKEKAYDTQMEIILSSLRDHADEYEQMLPYNDGEYVIVTLGQLKALGVVENSVINPLNGEEIEDSMELKITKKGSSHTYEIIEDTIETRESTSKSPIIELVGSPLEYYDVNTTYEEKGYKGYDYNCNVLEVTITNNINMTVKGIYNVFYTVTDGNGINSYAYRTVTYNHFLHTFIYMSQR